jgi:ribosome-associated translation inhibitor RaiA
MKSIIASMEKVEIQVRKFKDKLTDHSGDKSVKHIEAAEE